MINYFTCTFLALVFKEALGYAIKTYKNKGEKEAGRRMDFFMEHGKPLTDEEKECMDEIHELLKKRKITTSAAIKILDDTRMKIRIAAEKAVKKISVENL